MRRLLVPLLALVTVPAFCQSAENTVIQNAVAALGTNSSLYLLMTGTDRTGSVLTGYEYHTSIEISQVGNRIYDRVNITSYSGSGMYAKPDVSLIGDGVTLWRYDYVNNTYSAINYGTYSGLQPTDYADMLFRSLSSLSEGYMSYSALLLRQIYSGTPYGYQSWMPGVQPIVDVLGNASYSVGLPPRRTITFMLGGGSLTDIVYDDVTSMRGIVKRTDWTLHIQPVSTLDASLFSFVPPRGARPIAGPRIPAQHPSANTGSR